MAAKKKLDEATKAIVEKIGLNPNDKNKGVDEIDGLSEDRIIESVAVVVSRTKKKVK
jgi:hypothetical protein